MRLERRKTPGNDCLRRDDLRRHMSNWRWLLFAMMARLQLHEDEYLRVPNATTCDVDVKIT